MDDLYQLINVLKQILGYGETEFDRFSLRLKGREKLLFNKLRGTDNLKDADIFEELEFHYASDPNFRRYKRELKGKLIQQVLQYSPSYLKHSPYYSAYFSCQQTLACVNSLRALTRPKLAKSLADNLIKKSLHFNFTDVTSETALFLSRYFSTQQPNKEKALNFSQLCSEYTKILGYERSAELKYNEVISHYILTKSQNDIALDLAVKYVVELQPIALLNFNSSKFYLHYFLLKIITAEGRGEYKLALEYSESALSHFEKLPFDHQQGKKIFYRSVANCCVQLGMYSKAKIVLDKSISLQIKGREKWFLATRLQMQICIHLKEYSNAYRFYSEMRNQVTFNDLPFERKAIYNLYGAYLDFLAMVDMVPAVPVPTRFKINKFINEVPEFDRDNRGMKIPLIIAQLLYFIYDRNYDAMEQRLYALKQYCSIHLRRESPNFRSNCFIKMLLTIPVNNFNPVAVKRKAEKFVKRLELVPFAISQQPAEIEIVPYEHLWEIVLTHLSAPKRKRKRSMDKELFRVKGVE